MVTGNWIIFALMAVQVYIYNQEFIDRRYFLPMPVIILLSIMILYGAWLGLRQHLQNKSYEAILEKLSALSSRPSHLAFRLNDKEMDALVQLKTISKDDLVTVLKSSKADQFRIDLIISYCDL